MSVRGDILANVKKMLIGIVADATVTTTKTPVETTAFETTVDEIQDGDLSGADYPGRDVVLGVFQRSLRITASARAINVNDYPYLMAVGVRAFVRGTKKDILAKKDGLMNDIGRALFTDRARGDAKNPVDTREIDFSEESVVVEGAGAFAVFLATVVVGWLGDPRKP